MGNEWIEAVLVLMRSHGIAEFEFEDADRHIVASEGMVKAASLEVPTAAVPAPASQKILASHIGIFRTTAPDMISGNHLPRPVRGGEIVGYLQAGALLRPVLAPQSGILLKSLLADGALAGYGTPLFLFHASDTKAR